MPKKPIPIGASPEIARELSAGAVTLWNSKAGQHLVQLTPVHLHRLLGQYFVDRELLAEVTAEQDAIRARGESTLTTEMAGSNGTTMIVKHPLIPLRDAIERRLRKCEEKLSICSDEVAELDDEEEEAVEAKGDW